MEVVTALQEDFKAWLDLVREVEPLFGPMVSEEPFREALKNVINAGNAFCIREKNGPTGSELYGGVVIATDENEITWLAVAAKHRRQGIGEKLVSYAVDKLDKTKSISVTTFDETVEEGITARRLYSKLGFIDKEKRGNNPASIPVVLMTLDAKDEK